MTDSEMVRLGDVLEAVGNRIGRLRYHIAAGPDTSGRTCLENEMNRLEELMRGLQSLPRAAAACGDVWNPNMDEAPKDGSTVILWGPYFLEPVTARWEKHKNREQWMAAWDGSWVIEYQSDFGTDYKDADCPTHWRPLPHPPADSEE